MLLVFRNINFVQTKAVTLLEKRHWGTDPNWVNHVLVVAQKQTWWIM